MCVCVCERENKLGWDRGMVRRRNNSIRSNILCPKNWQTSYINHETNKQTKTKLWNRQYLALHFLTYIRNVRNHELRGHDAATKGMIQWRNAIATSSQFVLARTNIQNVGTDNEEGITTNWHYTIVRGDSIGCCCCYTMLGNWRGWRCVILPRESPRREDRRACCRSWLHFDGTSKETECAILYDVYVQYSIYTTVGQRFCFDRTNELKRSAAKKV